MFTRRLAPFPAFGELRREMDHLFDALGGWGDGFRIGRITTYPAVNVWEDGENFFVEAEIPGVELSDIELQVAGAELTLKGNRPGPSGKEAAALR